MTRLPENARKSDVRKMMDKVFNHDLSLLERFSAMNELIDWLNRLKKGLLNDRFDTKEYKEDEE
jgi:hypothetical protein